MWLAKGCCASQQVAPALLDHCLFVQYYCDVKMNLDKLGIGQERWLDSFLMACRHLLTGLRMSLGYSNYCRS